MCLLLVIPVLAGCRWSNDDAEKTPSATHTVLTHASTSLPALPHGRSTWAKRQRVVVADNLITVGKHTVDVSPLRADSAVTTLGGTYFLNAGELWFLDAGGARSTGFMHLTRIVVSANGRYLGFVDRNHGPSMGAGSQLAAAVVYDTTDGRVLVRSAMGMGTTKDDLARLYENPPAPLTFQHGALFVSTPHGTYLYPVSGATPSHVG